MSLRIRIGIAAAVVILLSPSGAEAGTAQISRIEIIAGNIQTRAVDINAHGQVTGYFTDSLGFNSAFRWHEGSAEILSPLVMPGNAVGEAINDSGDVVGLSTTPSPQGVLWEASNSKPGSLLVGGNSSWAFDLNSQGEIVGSRNSQAIFRGVDQNVVNIGAAFGSAVSLSVAINDSSLVVGRRVLGITTQSFRWSQTSGVESLSGLSEKDSVFAEDLNDSGTIVGWVRREDESTHAVSWEGSRIQLLGELAGSFGSEAYGVNSDGWIVGTTKTTSSSGGDEATLWMPSGSAVALHTLLSPEDASRWTLLAATNINDAGIVIGDGFYRLDDGSMVVRGFIMSIPSPPAGALVLIGLFGSRQIRRR